LGRPSENEVGYLRSALIGDEESAARLGGKDRFLLVHGAADRNVHLEHSMLLAHDLVKVGAPFRQQVNTLVASSERPLTMSSFRFIPTRATIWPAPRRTSSRRSPPSWASVWPTRVGSEGRRSDNCHPHIPITFLLQCHHPVLYERLKFSFPLK